MLGRAALPRRRLPPVAAGVTKVVMSTARKSRTAPAATSVKLPPHVKALAARAAKDAGVTVHAFLVEMIEQGTKRAMQRREFVRAAVASRDRYRRTGLAHRAEDVFAYLDAKAEGKEARRPKPVKIR